MTGIVQIRMEDKNGDESNFVNLLPEDIELFQKELERVKNLAVQEYKVVLTFGQMLVTIKKFL